MIYSVYYVELNIHFLLFMSIFIFFKKNISLNDLLLVFIVAFIVNHFGIIDDSLFNWLHENDYINRKINPQILKIYPLMIFTVIHLFMLFRKKSSIDLKFIAMINTMVLLSIFAFHNTFIYEGLTKIANVESMKKVYIALSIDNKTLLTKFCKQDDNLFCITIKNDDKIDDKTFKGIEKNKENADVITKSFKSLLDNKKPYFYAWTYTVSFTKTFIFGYKSDHKTYQTLIIDNNSSGSNFINAQTIFSTLSTISSTFWILLGFFALFFHKRNFVK